ncbi:hypothetical protein [Fulvivirga lutimaris]|uniref:hypothetical protein n=1 Tax=Fulvivirga lutimaris TaxID=1819566 RepID=UPI0012BD30C8|nr:hypothetical protein [Fulvivirga lutimaris]MTI39933.1 hypothetical protein [Fulvivirga lutimaris]
MKRTSYFLLIIISIGCQSESVQLADFNTSNSVDINSLDKLSSLDTSKGWFPHEVGNYWVNEDYIPCNDKTKEWYWEIIDGITTDSADYFLIEKHYNPCDTTDYYVYEEWFALTHDQKLYLSNEKFEFVRLEGDFKLNLDESYIAQGLRYTVIQKSKYRMVFEYDIYSHGTYTRRWIKGMGRELHWNRIQIGGKEYIKDIDYFKQ